jgi:hypothetical protein
MDPHRREDAMKHLPLLLGILAATASDAKAQNYPWCAHYAGGGGGATNCGFVSYAQCMQTLQGMGGFCEPNTQYVSPVAHSTRRPRAN